MDGVPMVTQCPILPFSSFRYNFNAEQTGTYFYSAHTVSQQGDGLYGSLIIHTPYDDLNHEKVLIFSSIPSAPLSLHIDPEPPVPTALTINGKTQHFELFVENNHQYRLRLINANAFNCPVAFSVADHLVEVLNVGGKDINPRKLTSHVLIFPGERFDVMLTANKSSRRYSLILQGAQDCKNSIHEASMVYDDVKSDDFYMNDNSHLYLDIPKELRGHGCQNLGENVICSLDLKGSGDKKIIQQSSTIYYIPFDVNYYEGITDDMTDYAFNIYGFSYYPSYLTAGKTDGVKIAQVNRMTFKYPPCPILSQPDAVPENMICSLDRRAQTCEYNPDFCECFQVISVPVKKVIEVILIDEGKGGNTSHVFHVHGYNVSVIGFHQFEKPITREEIVSLDQQKLLHRNLMDPLMMDTFTVPNKGYMILRFYTNNVGYWLWEARTTGVVSMTSGPPMQFLMRVGNRENMPTVPIDFPTCGNHKGPDLIFEDH
ncbi:iron transport multicopper oxidase FET5-like isoform X2 [Chelonus insularis]|nr:iron transport multicopper oxidase FET5-like isoform X2 [Chelonus insularis]